MYRAIAKNKRNTVLIIILFVILIGFLGFALSSLMGGDPLTVTIGTIIGAGTFTVIQYFAASKQALSMSGAIEIQKSDNPRLYRIVENLSITTGTPMPKVYIVNDPAPNAFATGRDPEHAAVAATTGILDLLDDSELEGVMAHEMGHVQNYDIRVSMIVFGLVVAVGFISDIALRFTLFGGRGNNNNSNPIMIIVGLAALVISPLVAAAVQASISRQREYLADATGALTTRHPDALASALQKLSDYSRPMKKQNSTMAHMWISDPTKPGIMDRLFSTHPPLADRVARLSKIGGGF
ncbi:M48 family metallopeptidase [Rhodoglobus aureus]|uniref:Protease HtpX homolog n=1 Tax=Rhodoglobus aureus TaxID=191497 RepID=A0ABN1VCS5_9MICO